MKRIIIFFLTVIIALPLLSQVRGKIDIPDLKGYVTLKCDFHVHTVFSHDGSVWPDVRIDEAYHEGLDAIAFTDHIEGWRFKDSLFSSRNRPYEIAQTAARDKGIILIKGGEIAYPAPVGEHNVIFSTNADELYKRNYMDAFSAAKAQNAFIFWNHPSLYYLQPDSTQWFPVHTQLLEQGMMHGIEVVNGPYSPEAHRWCLEKKLTMLGNSDAHQPYNLTFAYRKPRTMTLVFARDRTSEAIREALNERRTAIYFGDKIIGEEKYLKELFENALEWKVEKTGNTVKITVKNNSDLTFHLKRTDHDPRLVYVEELTIVPKGLHSRGLTIFLRNGITGGDVNFIVENFLVQPNEGMKYTLKIE